MKIAIMQPYFFPYLGYFNLINSVDLFVVYDNVQYIRRGWINRNRVLHQNKRKWQYINAPIEKASQQTLIKDIRIDREKLWEKNLLGKLYHYRNEAPYADEIIKLIENYLELIQNSALSKLNIKILEKLTALLGVDFTYCFASELDIRLDDKQSAEEKILDICEFLKADKYVNLFGGKDLYSDANFKKRNIKLQFLNFPIYRYNTNNYIFEPNLSIIDVLMWNKPQIIKKYLDEHKV